MNVKGWLTLSGIGVGLVAVAILAIAVPQELWTADAYLATGLLFLSFASPPLLPAPTPRNTETDAPQVWVIGPISQLWTLLVIVGVAAVLLALSGRHTLSSIASVLWLGFFFVGYALLQASTLVVAAAANQTSIASDDPRTKWSVIVRRCSLQTDNSEIRCLLDRLEERMRFAANELTGQSATENQAIFQSLASIEFALATPDELPQLIRSTEIMLEQREQSIRASRSRA